MSKRLSPPPSRRKVRGQFDWKKNLGSVVAMFADDTNHASDGSPGATKKDRIIAAGRMAVDPAATPELNVLVRNSWRFQGVPPGSPEWVAHANQPLDIPTMAIMIRSMASYGGINPLDDRSAEEVMAVVQRAVETPLARP